MPGHPVQSLSRDPEALSRILERQFAESVQLRRRIYAQLPLRGASVVLEPGCGTGLVLEEIRPLTDASLIGIDRDPAMVERARRRVRRARFHLADFTQCRIPPAEIIVLAHVLLHVADPRGLARKLHGSVCSSGFVAVLGEYDWLSASEDPDEGLLDLVRKSLREDGLVLETAGRASGIFEDAGFVRVEDGRCWTSPMQPDETFLSFQLPDRDPGPGSRERRGCRIRLPLVWGIYFRP